MTSFLSAIRQFVSEIEFFSYLAFVARIITSVETCDNILPGGSMLLGVYSVPLYQASVLS